MRALLPGALMTLVMVLLAFEAALPAPRPAHRRARETHRTSTERPAVAAPPRH